MFPERVETDRLVLEPLTPEYVDVLTFYRHASRHNPHIEEITEHLTWEPHATPKETLDFLESRAEAWAAGEDASYVVRLQEGEVGTTEGDDGASGRATEDDAGDPESGAGEVAGAAGLHPDWDRRTAILGTWLRKPFWGRGYSGERAAALMEIAFDRLDLEVVAVTHQTGNEQSRRAIEKYVEAHGGQREGLLRNWGVGPDGPVDVHRYTVTREQWSEATK
ncbi:MULTISPECIES: GNAT family N-acetyltransferase [Halorussus]|uniref:GNAT family N-acetyltransferase n=1 Tax=Halorussus TaxID=1070314 RepID=UPI000E212A02|nr:MULTISPECIES: GNAT family protein [Halorussus]NHN59552.1 GNAT family N-acetyltransferase [Halorussus sp. JP-T4]